MTELPAAEFARRVVERFDLTPADLVIEVGSGDGSRLRAVRDLGPRVVGIESDLLLMVTAWNAGIDTIRAAFNDSLARYLVDRYGPAKVVIASGRLPAAATCLAPDGVLIRPADLLQPQCRRAA
jgi:hypothetical protein